MAKKVFRQDSASVPAVLSAEEEQLAKLAQRNTKFEKDELVVPRLKMLQLQSPEAMEGGSQFVPGAKQGMFYNTSSGKLTPGQEGLICCIIGHQRQVIEWLPERGGMVKNWGMDEGWKALCDDKQRDALNPVTREGNIIDKQRSFLIFDVNVQTGEIDPSFFNMKSTSNRVANQLSTMLTQIRMRLSNGDVITPPYYYFLYKCTLERVQKEQYIWWLPRFVKYTDDKGMHVRTQSIPNGEEIFKQAVVFQEQFLEGTIHQDTYDPPTNTNDDLEGDKVTL